MMRINDIKEILNELLKLLNDPRFVEYATKEELMSLVEDFCEGVSSELISFKTKTKEEDEH